MTEQRTWCGKLILPTLVFASLLSYYKCDDTEVIPTSSGPVFGRILTSSEGKPISVFYGIPYATPPVGNLRFAPPITPEPWTTTLNATHPTPACYQEFTQDTLPGNITEYSDVSEDCLTLHVFTPRPKPQNAPVVVFIHGGGFLTGSSLWWVDHTILSSHGVITVAVNYRLGVFGFFGLGQQNAPGNLGLLDQLLAIHWVRENIEAFGGDKTKVTLFGASAGSASVGYHLLSPLSRGLFQRAIMISGAPTNTWAFREPEDIISQAENLFVRMGCNNTTKDESLQCLKQKKAEDILSAVFQPNIFLSPHFSPTLDGRFLVENPSYSVKNGSFNKADVLIGTSIDDAAVILLTSNNDVMSKPEGRIEKADFSTVIKRSMRGMTDLEAYALEFVYKYWSNQDESIMLRNAAKDIYNDGMFVCGVNLFSDGLVNSGNKVYRWLFDYKTAAAANLVPDWIKATHGAEQILLIGNAQARLPETEEDAEVRGRLLLDFLRFIRSGNPNNVTAEEHWPKYNDYHQFNHISSSQTVGYNYRYRTCALWNRFLSSIDI